MDYATLAHPPDLRRLQQRALLVGIAALALCGLGAIVSPAQFFHSYLMAYMLWLGMALGCLAIAMVHHLSGGAWGVVIRRILEAGTRTLPLMALLFIPLVFGIQSLYVWARPEAVAADEILQDKQIYLNVPFFLTRAAIYFFVWVGVSYFLNRWSLEQDRTAVPFSRRLQLLSAAGLVLYGLTTTFAAFDWMMSLEPHWFSTIFGVLIMGGQGLSALALVIATAFLLSRRKPFSDVMTTAHFHDLGNLLLAFVMLWAYFAFSQFLIIWSGNLTEEIPWYLHRLQTGWQGIGALLVLFHFAVPFVLLLSRGNKKSAGTLAAVASGLIVMRLVDLFWLIGPEAHSHGFAVHWLDLLAPIGIGGLWIAVFARELDARPLLPLKDPQLEEALAHGRLVHTTSA